MKLGPLPPGTAAPAHTAATAPGGPSLHPAVEPGAPLPLDRATVGSLLRESTPAGGPAARSLSSVQTATEPGPSAPSATVASPPRCIPSLDVSPSPVGPVATGYDPSNLDRTVRPQDDFYQYAVGGYLNAHPIPADKASWGVDGELVQRVQTTLHDILESLPCDAPAGSTEQKLRDFYRSGLDQTRIDAAGITPLRPVFERIEAIRDMQGVLDEVARMHAEGFEPMFAFYATNDAAHPQQVVGEACQGGLSLPNRDYYLSTDDPEKRRVREAFEAHVARMFALAGETPEQARRHAGDVLAIETALAEGSLSPEEMRDPQALQHPMRRDELARLTPHLDWNRYFERLGRPDIDSINVATPDFFVKLDETVATRSVDAWKTCLRWRALSQMAPYLSRDLEREDFAFNGTVLTGVAEQPERWKTVVQTTDEVLGDALGRKFVERCFTPQAKAKMLEMVDNIKSSLRAAITSGWMSQTSKDGALAKVDSLVAKIGYPDVWESYAGLEVHDDVYASNVMRAVAFATAKDLATIGRPKDPNKWEMTPSTVNAYYQPTSNEIVFPAAILQPPYFDVNADDAANYGATGATIGHELTHAFDDEGSQFDATGALSPWMTDPDQEAFQQRAAGVARQFDAFTFEGEHCNGDLVQGESIADLGGLEIAWDAWQRSRAGRPDPACDDGFTPEQRFFLNYALSWATSLRPEKARLMLSNDPHPLPQFRVIGPLANLKPFHEAFGVRPGDPMARPESDRNKLWTP